MSNRYVMQVLTRSHVCTYFRLTRERVNNEIAYFLQFESHYLLFKASVSSSEYVPMFFFRGRRRDKICPLSSTQQVHTISHPGAVCFKTNADWRKSIEHDMPVHLAWDRIGWPSPPLL